jgi:ribosome-associated translation inhibitor RaiA
MTVEEQTRLYALVQNPPKDSKIEAAKRFGIDLTLNLRRLQLSPTERAQEMDAALEFVRELQRAAQKTER